MIIFELKNNYVIDENFFINLLKTTTQVTEEIFTLDKSSSVSQRFQEIIFVND